MSAVAVALSRLVVRMVISMPAMAPQVDERAVLPEPRRGLTRDEVMTAAEVATCCTCRSPRVYYVARQGEIPACRVGRAWRFIRPRIEQLLGSS